jgi:hypothetical protein
MRRGSLIAVVGAACLVQASPAGASGLPADQFCVPAVLRDYEAPLEALPKVREPPRSGRLPFGPARLRFAPVAGQSEADALATEAEGIEFRFSLSGAELGPKDLDWDVTSRLMRVDRAGNELPSQRRKVEHLGRLAVGRSYEVGFGRAGSHGLYRYDLVFRDRAGGLLGRFHRYYVVVSPNWNTQLVLNGTSFRPGDEVRSQIQNPGPYRLSYGLAFSIDRKEGDRWVGVPLATLFGEGFAFPALGLNLGPGEADGCSAGFAVPESMEPGLYRIVKVVSTGGLTTLGAEFTIEPPA